MVSETAIVMIIAMVMVTLRHSPTNTSDRTYFKRIGVPSGSPQGSFIVDSGPVPGRTGAGHARAAGHGQP
ncbi:hypothetical protein GCM10027615_26710 [Plantactinospora veratri]